MNKDNRNKMIGVKLTPSEFDALTTICDAQKVSKSVFIRKLINNYIAEMVQQC